MSFKHVARKSKHPKKGTLAGRLSPVVQEHWIPCKSISGRRKTRTQDRHVCCIRERAKVSVSQPSVPPFQASPLQPILQSKPEQSFQNTILLRPFGSYSQCSLKCTPQSGHPISLQPQLNYLASSLQTPVSLLTSPHLSSGP